MRQIQDSWRVPKRQEGILPDPYLSAHTTTSPQPNFRSLCPSAVPIRTLCPLFQLPRGPKPYCHPQVGFIRKNASHEDRKRSLRLAEGLERSKPHPLLLDVLSVSLFRKMGVCCGEWLCKTVLKLFSLSGCFCWLQELIKRGQRNKGYYIF